MTEPISYALSGAGPAVVLLHPTGLGPAPLQPLVDRLDHDHLVIVPARRGYTMADGPSAPDTIPPRLPMPPPTSLDDQIDDLVGLLDRLDLPTATFVGVSGGATLLLALGLHHPDRIDGGLAHEPLIGTLAPDLHRTVAEAIGRMLADPTPSAVAAFVADLVGVDTWNRLPATWRDAVERHAAATRAEAAFYPAFEPTPPQLAMLADVGVVTSVGARSGPLRHEAAAVLRALGLASRTLARAGHLASVEAPDELTDLVRSLPRRGGLVR